MTSTDQRPHASPQAAPRELPRLEEPSRRWTVRKLGAVLLVWVVGWALFNGKQTLALGGAETTAFHQWLDEVRNTVENARAGNFFFHTVIGGASDGLTFLVTHLQTLLSTPAFPRPVPEIGWLGVVAVLAWLALAVAGWRAATLVATGFLAFGVLGIWQDAVDLLIVTAIAVLICVVVGLPLGIAMARGQRVSAVFTPILDIMQTMPAFAYLTPLALFWGIGPAGAIVTTFIYAMPPLARIAEHAIRGVSPTTIEAARSLGLTGTQLLTKVQLPMARRTIVVGINQSTLAALSMATIAALIDGPGLGKPVVQALQSLDVGAAFVGGLGIVIMAIMLDRTTTAASERAERVARSRRRGPAWLRPAVLGVALLLALALVYLSRVYLWAAEFPASVSIRSPLASGVSALSSWVVNTFDTVTTPFKNVVSYGLLNPFQSLLEQSPWWLMAVVILAVAFILGGRRALLVSLVCEAVILGTGLWNDAMQTLTMTVVATVLVMVVAVVVGVWMGRRRRADLVIRPFLDAFQTIPSFVYLVPAIALFNVGRFTAIVAAVAYSFPVATKLVADGIRGVSETTLEATRSVGSTAWQTITKVQLPMARSGLLLATNQGLLYVLSMVVIGGLVGAGSLGYLVVAGFSQRQLFGKGLAAGIAITALGVMLDRVTRHAAARQQ